jgi:hypothetical protein
MYLVNPLSCIAPTLLFYSVERQTILLVKWRAIDDFQILLWGRGAKKLGGRCICRESAGTFANGENPSMSSI